MADDVYIDSVCFVSRWSFAAFWHTGNNKFVYIAPPKKNHIVLLLTLISGQNVTTQLSIISASYLSFYLPPNCWLPRKVVYNKVLIFLLSQNMRVEKRKKNRKQKQTQGGPQQCQMSFKICDTFTDIDNNKYATQ